MMIATNIFNTPPQADAKMLIKPNLDKELCNTALKSAFMKNISQLIYKVNVRSRKFSS